MPQDITDSSAVLGMLAKPTPFFTDEQRTSMASAVSSRMGSGSKAVTTSLTQNNAFLYNYFTDKLWEFIMNTDNSWESKLEHMGDFMVKILGLRHPSDSTVKDAIAILAHCHPRTLQPNEAYNCIHAFKTKVAAKRLIIAGAPTEKEFPMDVNDFTRLHPKAYLENEPPVKGRVDPVKIKMMTRKDLMPTRSTNRMIAQHSHEKAPSTSSKASSPSSDFGKALLDRLLHGEGESPRKRYKSKAPDRDAACFVNQANTPNPVPAAEPLAAPTLGTKKNLADTIADAKKTLLSNKKCKPKADDSAAEEEDEEDEAELGVHIAPVVQHKPAAPKKSILKKPAASAAKAKGGPRGAYRDYSVGDLLKLLPKHFKPTFLKRAAAKELERNSFTSRSYHNFSKNDKEKARIAFACAGKFWDSVNK